MFGVETKVSNTPQALQKKEKPSFEALLEAKIKHYLAGGNAEKAKRVDVNDVEQFKTFLNDINNWILNGKDAQDYSLEERKNTVSGASNGAKSMAQIYFEAQEGLKGRSPHESLILEAEKTILENIETTVDNLSYTDHLSITDKASFIGFNENQSLGLAKVLGSHSEKIKNNQVGFSVAEQKVALYEVLETAAKAASEVQVDDKDQRNAKKAEVFETTLNQALAKNSHKFSKEFLENSAQELTNNAGLVGTTRKMALVNKKNPNLISYIAGGSEKALAEIGTREKAWERVTDGLDAKDLQEVVDRANDFIFSVKGLDLKNEETSKKNIEIIDQAQTDAMKFHESDPKAEQKAKAVNAYIKLSSAKALEAKDVKNSTASAMPKFLEQAFGAIAVLAIGKFVLGFVGAKSVNPALAAQGIKAGGGLLPKAMGLLAIGGALNGLNFNLNVNDEAEDSKIETSKAKQKPPEHKKSQKKAVLI